MKFSIFETKTNLFVNFQSFERTEKYFQILRNIFFSRKSDKFTSLSSSIIKEIIQIKRIISIIPFLLFIFDCSSILFSCLNSNKRA
jgi:hypothetical protein